jgi:putative membrane protein
MSRGFLGNDASFMLDFVVCALLLLVPALTYSIYLVRVKRKYLLHRNLQSLLAVILALAVAAFEVDMRLHGGWKNIVNKDPAQPRLDEAELAGVQKILYVHLVFAVSTPFLWGATIWLGWRRFPDPPVPGPHSRLHKNLGWASAVDLTLTSVTGLWFYYNAFMTG